LTRRSQSWQWSGMDSTKTEPTQVNAKQAQSRGGSATTDRLIDALLAMRFADLPADTVHNARTFLADTLAVGVAGLCEPVSDKVFRTAQKTMETGDCRVLGRPGVTLSAHGAALVNGTQVHCLEWDALHEPSVVIALCTTTAAIISQTGLSDPALDDALLALVAGVETAVFFGAGATTQPRFFRPSTAGAMGAAMAVGILRGFDRTQLRDLLGLAYSQVSGTMQAHWEGSEALPLQIGIAARAALTAADLVEEGMTGPHDVIDGKFGYFTLVETADELEFLFDEWGAPWKITEVAHKPFPAGRATQATLTAIMEAQAEHAFSWDDVTEITAKVPPLIMLLVGREYRADMSSGYARLCLEYVAPQMVRHGLIDPRRFAPEFTSAPQAGFDAAKIHLELDGNPDPNGLSPQTITIGFADGRSFTTTVEIPYGSPHRPMSREDQLAKARLCYEAGGLNRDPSDLFDAIFNPVPDAQMRDILALVTS
jgi:2-methylcitrate dehydratase PrpD